VTPPRLVLRLESAGDELIIEFAAGDASSHEELAPCSLLDRDAHGKPLRLRLQGLTAQRTTNAFMAPMVRCGEKEPMKGPGGGECYWFCLLPHERDDQVFHPAREVP
jgi:hypothetical protein